MVRAYLIDVLILLVPKKMYPLEMDYGQDAENIKKLDLTKSKSKLDKKVQELITTIFDIESMKKAMIEFEIDMTKMPMGKHIHTLDFLRNISDSKEPSLVICYPVS